MFEDGSSVKEKLKVDAEAIPTFVTVSVSKIALEKRKARIARATVQIKNIRSGDLIMAAPRQIGESHMDFITNVHSVSNIGQTKNLAGMIWRAAREGRVGGPLRRAILPLALVLSAISPGGSRTPSD